MREAATLVRCRRYRLDERTGILETVFDYGYMAARATMFDGDLIEWANERANKLRLKGIHQRGFNRDTPGRQAAEQRVDLNRAGTSTGDSRTGETKAVVRGGPGSAHAHPSSDTAGESATDRRKERTTGAPGSASSPQVRNTSLEAYRALRSSGALSAQQVVIIDHFIARPGLRTTRQELARQLEIGINAICGRVSELMEADPPILIERGRKRCGVTGRDVNALELAA